MGQPAWVRNPHGAFIVDGKEVGNTLQCPHCGGHFLSVRGSGARRTWCMRCMAVTCGNHSCDACRPYEQQMAEIEAKAGIR
jgi:hypothetical protein